MTTTNTPQPSIDAVMEAARRYGAAAADSVGGVSTRRTETYVDLERAVRLCAYDFALAVLEWPWAEYRKDLAAFGPENAGACAEWLAMKTAVRLRELRHARATTRRAWPDGGTHDL